MDEFGGTLLDVDEFGGELLETDEFGGKLLAEDPLTPTPVSVSHSRNSVV